MYNSQPGVGITL